MSDSRYSYGQPGQGCLPPATGAGHEAERVLQLRAAFAHGYLDGGKAAALRMWLTALEGKSGEPVVLHLSAGDASLRAVFTVADTIEAMCSPVHVHLTGQAGGAVLALLGPAHRRTMAPHATLRLAEPQEKFDGTAAELALREFEHRWLTDALYASLAAVTSRPAGEIRDDAERIRLFTPAQALAYGFIDHIQEPQARNAGPEAG